MLQLAFFSLSMLVLYMYIQDVTVGISPLRLPPCVEFIQPVLPATVICQYLYASGLNNGLDVPFVLNPRAQAIDLLSLCLALMVQILLSVWIKPQIFILNDVLLNRGIRLARLELQLQFGSFALTVLNRRQPGFPRWKHNAIEERRARDVASRATLNRA